MSYAIIRTGGKQYSVEEGSTLHIPSIDKKVGEKVELETLLVSSGDNVTVGAGTVSATVTENGREKKIIVFKKKRRKQYKRKQGHRQGFTAITIDSF